MKQYERAFNSLFEILGRSLGSSIHWPSLLSILFLRFSEYEKMIERKRSRLSILFLRFRWGIGLSIRLKEISFNSLFEIQGWSTIPEASRVLDFQFSFWDSIVYEPPEYKKTFKPFNSLFEILGWCISGSPSLFMVFQFSFWDSSSYYKGYVLEREINFQFSFWDSRSRN